MFTIKHEKVEFFTMSLSTLTSSKGQIEYQVKAHYKLPVTSKLSNDKSLTLFTSKTEAPAKKEAARINAMNPEQIDELVMRFIRAKGNFGPRFRATMEELYAKGSK